MINAIADVSTVESWGFMRNQQINCDDCEFKATSTIDMGNLVNLEHKVKKHFLVNDVTLNQNIAGD